MSDASTEAPLLRAIDGRDIATLTFNRPERARYSGAVPIRYWTGRAWAPPAVRHRAARQAFQIAGAEVGAAEEKRARPFRA